SPALRTRSGSTWMIPRRGAHGHTSHTIRRRTGMQFRGFGRDLGRRQVGIVLTALVLMMPVGAAPTRSGPEGAAPPAPARATEPWEEMLLLEALRYLRVSPPLLAPLQPLAQTAADRLGQGRAQSERMGAPLGQWAQQRREALRQGRRPSTANEAEALRLRRAGK